MISITAAANTFRRVRSSTVSHRPFGVHLKAFGSGRIAFSALNNREDEDEDEQSFNDNENCELFVNNNPNVSNYFCKIFCALLKIFRMFVTLFYGILFLTSPKLSNCRKSINSSRRFKAINEINANLMFHVRDLLAVKASCKKFCQIIDLYANELPKFMIDQVKLHFDEGEVIIYPLDEKIIPIRHKMPSIEHFSSQFRHVSALSLFIRGLIPIETVPVLKKLTRLRLNFTQIYFLWCEFDVDAEDYLVEFFHSNAELLSDIGFETCTPPQVISDRLFQHNLEKLISLRVWNESTTYQQKRPLSDCEMNNNYVITDRTLIDLAKHYLTGNTRLVAIDLAFVNCTINGIFSLIAAWYQRPPVTNLSIGFHQCNNTSNRNLEKEFVFEDQCDVLIRYCNKSEIPLTRSGLCHANGYCLLLSVT